MRLPTCIFDRPRRGLRTREQTCQANTVLSIPWKQDNQVWSNHGIIDSDDTFLGYLPTQRIFRPTDPYQVSFAITEAENSGKKVRAIGSGWSFSDAVLPQSEALSAEEQRSVAGVKTKVEQAMLHDKFDEAPLRWLAYRFSHHFGEAIDTTSLDRSLQTLLPNILDVGQDIKGLLFVEAGMTIYDLNILLDSDPNDKERRALRTMGGACGQTIGSAISTGTHGGDFNLPPPADSVRAIYLIGQGDFHHWIEPATKPITERGKILATFP
jgi:FAD/FMN-containing dehydrogenase